VRKQNGEHNFLIGVSSSLIHPEKKKTFSKRASFRAKSLPTRQVLADLQHQCMTFKEAIYANNTISIRAICTDDHENIYFYLIYFKIKATVTTISYCILPTCSSGIETVE
jgi:hypothetical protein